MFDNFDFLFAGFSPNRDIGPTTDGKRVIIGDDVWVALKSDYDASLLNCWITEDGAGGRACLKIDGGKCEREVRLVFELRSLAPLIPRRGIRRRLLLDLDLEFVGEGSGTESIVEWVSILTRDVVDGSHKLAQSVEKEISIDRNGYRLRRTVEVDLSHTHAAVCVGVQVQPSGGPVVISECSVTVVGVQGSLVDFFNPNNLDVYSALAHIREGYLFPPKCIVLHERKIVLCDIKTSSMPISSDIDGIVVSIDLNELWKSLIQQAEVLVAYFDLLVYVDKSDFSLMRVITDPDSRGEGAVFRTISVYSTSVREAEQQLKARNFAGALCNVRGLDVSRDETAFRLKVSALYGFRRHEEILRLCHSVNRSLRNSALVVEKEVEALFATGRVEAATQRICDIILDFGSESKDALAPLPRFSALLDGPLRRLLAGRILDDTKLIESVPGSVMRCAHDMIEDGCPDLAFALFGALSIVNRYPTQQADILLLQAQLAFRFGRYGLQAHHLSRAIGLSGGVNVHLVDSNAPVTPTNLRPGRGYSYYSDGPLISVGMSTYNSGASFKAAITSILSQSYRNVEVIVVDDRSTDDTRDQIVDIVSADKRVRAVFKNENSGPYVSRNIAVREARGDYVVFQDSDDWAHPDKVKILLDRLHRSSSLVATGNQHVRCSHENGFRCRTRYLADDASSLMWPREVVLERAGYFDCVRAGADSEFQLRLQRIFGEQAVSFGPELLSIVSGRTNTLSSSGIYAIDESTGIGSIWRCRYQEQYQLLHEGGPPLKKEFSDVDVEYEIL